MSPAENTEAGADDFDALAEEHTSALGRKKSTGAKPGEGTNQVLIRASAESHARWKEAAAKTGVSMSEFIREAADKAASNLLDCFHRAEHRRWYPWAEACLKCGKQLRDGKTWLVDPHSIPHVKPLDGNPAVR